MLNSGFTKRMVVDADSRGGAHFVFVVNVCFCVCVCIARVQ